MSEAVANPSLRALFENHKRVVYDSNPLVEVILQVRFPTYLRLHSEVPSKFQDVLLSEYPLYELEEFLEMVPPSSSTTPPSLREVKVHRFLSQDKNWRIALMADNVSISTKDYVRWEAFRDRARFCLKAFFGQYPIKVITRVGLRYRDLIRRSKIEKHDREWSDLINPALLGPMGSEAFQSVLPFEAARWSQRFVADDVRINFQGGLRTQEGEKCYFLDCDMSFLKETIVGEDVLQSDLERLHSPGGPLFRWAITDELHESLGPKPA